MILVWHRGDLRTHDHAALHAAAHEGACVPVFVLDPGLLSPAYSGNNRIQYLYANLQALAQSYAALGSGLVVRLGKPAQEIVRLAQETKARAVYALRSYEPVGRERDAHVQQELQQHGINLVLFDGDCILEPGRVLTGAGAPYTVFTPFWRNWNAQPMPQPLPAPLRLPPHQHAGVQVPTPQASVPLPAVGQDAALAALEDFVKRVGMRYENLRNTPSLPGTSGLSAPLHLGVISPRVAATQAAKLGLTAWVRELCWRDFYRHLLWFMPHLATQAHKETWRDFPWRDHTGEAKADFEAWRNAQTGYPIVDAGMRQLHTTGLMHNRVRMIVASFLCKHLLVSWQAGEAVFNDLLLDGDLASNNGGWQWCAGCGVDAAPYFRVFNPVTQSEKFDPDAAYIKTHLPELAHLDAKTANAPWLQGRRIAGCPAPVVDLGFGRERFLVVAKKHLKPETTAQETLW